MFNTFVMMQKELINLLAKSILDGKVRRESDILIDIQGGQIVFESVEMSKTSN